MIYHDAYAIAIKLGFKNPEEFRGKIIKQREPSDPPMTETEIEEWIAAGVDFIMNGPGGD